MSSNHPIPYDFLTKILLIGDSGVGKTSLLVRFNEQTFTTTHITTIGIDLRSKVVDVEGSKVKVQIWDTAGQERFQSITKSYYRGSHAILLVYDTSDLKSFKRITHWVSDIKKQMADSDNFMIVLVANKCDLESDRQVSYEDGRQLADEYGMKYYETSAKNPKVKIKLDGEILNSVDHMFSQTIKDIMTHVLYKPTLDVIKPQIDLHQGGTLSKSMRKCC
jgi:small GTP-binding protein